MQNIEHNGKLRSKKNSCLPFVEMNGEEITDSEAIIKHLSKTFDKDMDEGLSEDQAGVHYAMSTMVDNHLNW